MAVNYLGEISGGCRLPGTWDLMHVIRHMLENELTDRDKVLIERIITRPIPPSPWEKIKKPWNNK
jgi:hypothetical protein